MATGQNRISYGELTELDLEEVEGLGDDELRARFLALAQLATAGQLRMFLDARPGEDDEADRRYLEEAFVERRLEGIRKMREAKILFDAALAPILGEDQRS